MPVVTSDDEASSASIKSKYFSSARSTVSTTHGSGGTEKQQKDGWGEGEGEGRDKERRPQISDYGFGHDDDYACSSEDDDAESSSASCAAPSVAKKTMKRPTMPRVQKQKRKRVGPIENVDLVTRGARADGVNDDGSMDMEAGESPGGFRYFPISSIRQNVSTAGCPCCRWCFGMPIVDPKKQEPLVRLLMLYEKLRDAFPLEEVATKVAKFFNEDVKPWGEARGKNVEAWSASVVKTHLTYCLIDPKLIMYQEMRDMWSAIQEIKGLMYGHTGTRPFGDPKMIGSYVKMMESYKRMFATNMTKLASTMRADRSVAGMLAAPPPSYKPR